MAFDLAQNNFGEIAEAGYEFNLTLPGTGDPTDAFITVRGDQSKTVKAFNRKKFNEFKLKEQQAKRRNQDSDLSLEEAEEIAIETAIVRVISWKGFEEQGVVVPFTKENAQKIFAEHPWIREQVIEESSQILNFRPK